MSDIDPNYRPNIVYQLEDKLPARTAAFVGIQHVMAMFVGIITMPLVVSGTLKFSLADTAYLVSMGLFISGISTIIQTICFDSWSGSWGSHPFALRHGRYRWGPNIATG
jgi:xanthine/uracil permease